MPTARIAGLSLILLSFFVLLGCEKAEKIDFKTPYQVVFLDNNNTYIGKIQHVGKDYIHLNNVFYIQSQVNPETKQVSNLLVKRGQEWHKPDLMYINMRHILIIEPVTPDSQVAKLIEQSESQKK